MMRVLSRLQNIPWATNAETLGLILEVASRENQSVEAISAKLGRPLENTRTVTRRGDIAIIPVSGPLFRYANLFTAISGATSYETLAKDFDIALNDPSIRSIVLSIDSPGGEVSGLSEFADQIFAAREKKNIIAHVDGMAASAGYWLASAASEVMVNEIGLLGSIGVVLTVQDSSGADAKAGIKTYEIVSAQSPDKRLNIGSEDGQNKIQALANRMADVFIDKVARNRGVDVETVLADFGHGGIFVGADGVNAGLADRVGNFEELIAELTTGSYVTPVRTIAAKTGITLEQEKMNNKTDANSGTETTDAATAAANAAAETAKADAAAATAAQAEKDKATAKAVDDAKASGDVSKTERARIQAITTCAEAEGRTTLANHLAFNTETTLEDAKAILASSAKAGANAGFEKAMADVKNPAVAPGKASDEGKSEDDKAFEAMQATAQAQGLAPKSQ